MSKGEMVGIPEVARCLGVSENTVRRMVLDKEIPHYKVRGQYRFDIEEVRRELKAEV